MMHNTVISVVLLLIVGTVSANEFGRLFTTPEQRQQLDRLRYQQDLEPLELNLGMEEKQTQDDTEHSSKISIRVNGLIVREGDITSEQVEIKLPGNKKIIRLKVGEEYISRGNNTTDKSFDRNDEITVKE